MFWTTLSISDGRIDIFEFHLRNYVSCMAGGSRENHDCDMQRLNLEAESYPELEIIYIMLIACGNFSALTFVVNFQTVKGYIKRAAGKFSSGSTS